MTAFGSQIDKVRNGNSFVKIFTLAIFVCKIDVCRKMTAGQMGTKPCVYEHLQKTPFKKLGFLCKQIIIMLYRVAESIYGIRS